MKLIYPQMVSHDEIRLPTIEISWWNHRFPVTIRRAHKFTKIGTLFVTVFALDVPGSSYFVSKWVISLKIPWRILRCLTPLSNDLRTSRDILVAVCSSSYLISVLLGSFYMQGFSRCWSQRKDRKTTQVMWDYSRPFSGSLLSHQYNGK